jgi:DNA-binding CsgD family transcriptional regulator
MGDPEDPTSIWAMRPRLRARRRVAILLGSGEGVPRLVALRDAEAVIGRGAEANVRLTARGVSRQHAKIVLGGGDSATVVDLQSRNGTFVNGARIDVSPLREGDEIAIGPVAVLQFTRRDEDELLDVRTQAGMADLSALTPRQREIAKLVAEGLSNPQIAEKLQLKPRTVTSHLEQVFARLDIRSRTELTRLIVSGQAHGGSC